MRVYVAVALLVMGALAGCSDKKDEDDGVGDDAVGGGPGTGAAATLPTLRLGITIGNQTSNFTSAGSAMVHGGHSTSSSHTMTATGNATGNATGVAGNSTGNATGNVTMPSGAAPLDVTFALSATGVANGTALNWTLDFGRAVGNPTANATGNATASGQRNGTALPAMLNHTYTAVGDYNVTFVLRAGTLAAQSVRATIHVGNGTGNVSVTPALPAVTHFEYGESWGCDGSTGTPACIDFVAGPPGNDLDGHWIALGETYWGLALTSTVDQGPGPLADSDCVFTDDSGEGIIGEANNGSGPCTGTVPEGAAWLFVYPYGVGAFGMTVDFGVAA